MDNFIFSLNATMPIFLLMILGKIFKVIGITNDNFAQVSDKFVFNVCLPVMVFLDIANTNIKEDFDLSFILFCILATTISFVVIWILAEVLSKDKDIVGAFVQASYRSSAAILGVAFVQNMYGSSGMAPMMIVAAVPFFNIFAVIVLTFKAKDAQNLDKKEAIKKAFINILKNPIIIGIFLGVIASYFQIKFPVIIEKTLNNLGVLSTPLAILSLGATFQGRDAIAKVKPTIISSIIKLIVLPAIFLPIAIYMGFRKEMLIAILIMLGAPTTISCYIMAKNMNNDYILTSSIVVVTTLFSSVTLTLWIFILKSMALI